MARVFIDGGESGTLSKWDYISGTGTYGTSSQKYTGTYSIYAGGGSSGYCEKYLSAQSDYYFAFKLYLNTTTISTISFWEDGTHHCNLFYYNNGDLAARRTSTWLDYTSGISLYRWYKIQIYVKIDDTVGRFVVKVDGVTQIDFTGDTRNGGTSGVINKVRFGWDSVNNSGAYFDDFVVDDSDWPGDTRIAGYPVEANGANNDWTALSGNNYENVDEVPPSAADYVYTNVGSYYDLYQVTSQSPTDFYSIKCVQLEISGWYEGAPTPTNLQPVIRTGATPALYYGASSPTQANSYSHVKLWENNPDTASAWALSEVNSLQIGMQALT